MSTKISSQHRVSSLRFVLSTLYPFRGYLAALILILLVYSGNVFLKTQLIKILVDAVVQASSTLDELWALVGHFGVVLLIELLAFRSQEWCALRYEPALQNHVTALVFEHTLQREYCFFQKNLAGNLAAKVHDVATGIPATLAIFLYDYFVNFLFVVVAFFTLWGVSVWLAFAVVVWSLWTILIAALITRRSLQLASTVAEEAVQITGHMTDVFSNALTTRLCAAQAHVLRRLHRFQTGYLKSSKQYRWLMLKFYTLQGASFQLYQGVMYAAPDTYVRSA